MQYHAQGNRLILRRGQELVWIEPWGINSLRVRATRRASMTGNDWALMEPVEPLSPTIRIETVDMTEPWYRDRPDRQRTGTVASITNGTLTAEANDEGWLTFRNAEGKVLLQEYWRQRGHIDRYCAPLRIDARELRPIPGTDDFQLTMRFEAFDDERTAQQGGLRARARPAQLPGFRSLLSLKPWLWLPVEQPGHRSVHIRYEPDGMDQRILQGTRLLDHGRGYTCPD